MVKLTKKQVIRELQRRGWTIVSDNGRTVDAVPAGGPINGHVGRFEPRLLLEELEREERKQMNAGVAERSRFVKNF